MQRRTFVATSVGALVAVSATAQDGGLAARAPGVWSLVEAKTIAGDEVTSWFGRKEPISGLLIYTATGWMSVQITGARLATPSRADYEALPDGEKSAWLEAYYAYYGRFDIDEAAGTIAHRVVDSLLPYESGMVLTRRIAIDGDRLTLLTMPRVQDGRTSHNRLMWKRV